MTVSFCTWMGTPNTFLPCQRLTMWVKIQGDGPHHYRVARVQSTKSGRGSPQNRSLQRTGREQPGTIRKGEADGLAEARPVSGGLLGCVGLHHPLSLSAWQFS